MHPNYTLLKKYIINAVMIPGELVSTWEGEYVLLNII